MAISKGHKVLVSHIWYLGLSYALQGMPHPIPPKTRYMSRYFCGHVFKVTLSITRYINYTELITSQSVA